MYFFEVYKQKIVTLNFDKMMTLKKKRSYEDPFTTVTQTDLEGLICNSIVYLVETDEIHNMNAEVDSSGNPVEQFYLEF